MYKCESCKTQVGSGIPCNIVVVETRTKVYPARLNVGDPGGIGREIVKELQLCRKCKGE